MQRKKGDEGWTCGVRDIARHIHISGKTFHRPDASFDNEVSACQVRSVNTENELFTIRIRKKSQLNKQNCETCVDIEMDRDQ